MSTSEKIVPKSSNSHLKTFPQLSLFQSIQNQHIFGMFDTQVNNLTYVHNYYLSQTNATFSKTYRLLFYKPPAYNFNSHFFIIFSTTIEFAHRYLKITNSFSFRHIPVIIIRQSEVVLCVLNKERTLL